ncbi:hypothetical protein RND81_07G056600 [Saponaria officinalis]|uniref:Uncharacterized protein n=1 Tax=Saponaria officinalis TaxID=3572 RepID=A0AAW1JM60_SAPOF
MRAKLFIYSYIYTVYSFKNHCILSDYEKKCICKVYMFLMRRELFGYGYSYTIYSFKNRCILLVIKGVNNLELPSTTTQALLSPPPISHAQLSFFLFATLIYHLFKFGVVLCQNMAIDIR